MEMETITFANHLGEKLAGTLIRPVRAPRGGIVVGHCFTCSRQTLILRRLSEHLAEAGFIVLRFDFSGNGQSEGTFVDSTYSKQIMEVHAAVDFVMHQGVSWIGLGGHSLGGMVSLLAAEGIPQCKAVCTIAARATVTHESFLLTEAQRVELKNRHEVEFSSRGRSLVLSEIFFKDATQYDILTIMSRLTLPILLVHGDHDEITAVDNARRLAEANPENARTYIVPEADHMFSREDHRQAVARQVTSWFKKWNEQ